MTITEQARNLRKNPSPNEKTLWSMLRAQRMGYKFVRQHPVIFRSQQNKNYVFYLTYFSRTHNLAIEVDEPVDDIQRDFFVLRDSILEGNGRQDPQTEKRGLQKPPHPETKD